MHIKKALKAFKKNYKSLKKMYFLTKNFLVGKSEMQSSVRKRYVRLFRTKVYVQKIEMACKTRCNFRHVLLLQVLTVATNVET